MQPLTLTPELEVVAHHTVWFKTPAEAVKNPCHFTAHVLTYGTFEDVQALRKHVSDEALCEALDHAPPGIFDARSWAYWNLKLAGRYPAPPMPKCHFAAA